MAQRYADNAARERMAAGKCPGCGEPPEAHVNDARFWIPRNCDLLPHGVTERIGQYRADQSEKFSAKDYAATHPIVCAHADKDSGGSHILAPGEKCGRGKP